MLVKIILDLDQIDLNKLFEKINKKGIELCFADDCIYAYKADNVQSSIKDIMKELSIKNFFLKEVKEKPEVYNGNLAQSWCCEKIQQDEESRVNLQHQSELQQMMKNIEEIKKTLIQQSKKEGEVDGRKT